MMLMELIAIFLLFLSAFYIYYRYVLFNFWRKRGVFYVEPIVPTGNATAFVMGKQSAGKYLCVAIMHLFVLIRFVYFIYYIYTYRFLSSIGQFFYEAYVKHKEHRIFGMYLFFKPNLLINDLDLIRHVLTKEFDNFRDRGIFFDRKIDPLSAHMFFLTGKEWRNLRANMTPTFTSAKIKQMFSILSECGEQLANSLEGHARTKACIDAKDIFTR